MALLPLNGAYLLTVTALTNHKDSRAEAIEQIVRFIYQRLPGSYGLLYEWNDETDDPPSRNAFRVRVVAMRQHPQQRPTKPKKALPPPRVVVTPKKRRARHGTYTQEPSPTQGWEGVFQGLYIEYT